MHSVSFRSPCLTTEAAFGEVTTFLLVFIRLIFAFLFP